MQTRCSACHVLAWMAAAAVLISATPHSAVSQEARIPYVDYLQAAGLYENARELEDLLLERLERAFPELPADYHEHNAHFFSFVLSINGLTPQVLGPLEEAGIDLVRTMTADVRPLDEQSLLSDVAVLGRVVDVERTPAANDGFAVSVQVLVEEYLKGHAPGDTIIIRQRERQRAAGSDTRPEMDRSYLLLLSGGMYTYQKTNHEARQTGEAYVRLPDQGEAHKFVIYRLYPYVDGRLDWQNLTRRQTEEAFEGIRVVERLLTGSRNGGHE